MKSCVLLLNNLQTNGKSGECLSRYRYLSKCGALSLRLDSDGLCASLKNLVNVFLAEFGAFVFLIHQGTICTLPQKVLHLHLRQLLHLLKASKQLSWKAICDSITPLSTLSYTPTQQSKTHEKIRSQMVLQYTSVGSTWVDQQNRCIGLQLQGKLHHSLESVV